VTLSSLVFCSVFAAISRDCNYDALADSPSRKDYGEYLLPLAGAPRQGLDILVVDRLRLA
jgi:hypothetical protein